MVLDIICVVLFCVWPDTRLGINLIPCPHPCRYCVIPCLGDVQALSFANGGFQLFLNLRLGFSQHVFDDAFACVGIVSGSVAALPAAVVSFANISFSIALLFFLQPFPLVEKLVFAAQRAHLGLQSVGEDQEGVVVEQVGDGVQIVGVVVGVGVLHVHPGGLQLHEKQRNAVDKAHDICPATVEVAVNFQLPDGEEVVVGRVLEVDDGGVFFLCSAAGLLHSDGDAVPNQEILFLVDLQQGCGGQTVFHEPLGLVQLGGGEPRIQAQKSLPKIPGQQDFLVALAAQCAGLA